MANLSGELKIQVLNRIPKTVEDNFLTKQLVTRATLVEKRELKQMLEDQFGPDRQLAVLTRAQARRRVEVNLEE